MKTTQGKKSQEEAAALGFENAEEMEQCAVSLGITPGELISRLHEEILRPAGFIDWKECRLGKLSAKSFKKKYSNLDKRLRTRQTQQERYALYKETIVVLENLRTREEGLCIGFDDDVQGHEYQDCELALEITKRKSLEPDAQRGKKVIRAAAAGGATRKGAFKVHPSVIKNALMGFLPKCHTLTRARERTASQLGIRLRTVVTHTKELKKPSPV